MAVARVVYVMGPSGAGKDAVMRFARDRLDGGYDVLFAHRYATRPADAGHPNEVALGPGEYALRMGKGLFAFAWDAWGVRYAVGSEVRAWTACGLTVVVSGSREHFVQTLGGDPAVLPVLVTAPAAERAARLRARAREGEAAIVERLRRGDAIHPAHPALVTIDNAGALERAGGALVEILIAEAGAR